MKHTFSIVSLFSGCGGLDLGFSREDTKFLYACDHDESAVKCFNHNFSHVATVRDVQDENFLNDIRSIGNADIVLGGFPCQGFSKSGPKRESDPRNVLYLSMVEAVKILNPKVFVAENVDGMAQNYKGQFVSQIVQDFSTLGYIVEPKILNAVDFGVPQYRRRIIFIGIQKDLRSDMFTWPESTHKGGTRNGEFKSAMELGGYLPFFNESKPLKNMVTIKDAIADLLETGENFSDHTYIAPTKQQDAIIAKIGFGQKLCNVRFAKTSVYTWQIPEVFGHIENKEILILETIGKNRRKKQYGNIPNGNPLSLDIVNEILDENFTKSDFDNLVAKGYLKEKDGKYDLTGAMFCSGLFRRPDWNDASPTIITVFYNARYFVHPIKNRPFTIREVARLQSFPDDFKFLEAGISKQDAYRLIGNAVPPRLAGHIAESILKFLKTESEYETSKHNSIKYRETERV